MGLGGLEPPTLRLSGVYSNQLSYKLVTGFYICVKEKVMPGEARTPNRSIRSRVL